MEPPMTRDELAYHLFKIMNAGTDWVKQNTWEHYQRHVWDLGYYRIVDEILKKGYHV